MDEGRSVEQVVLSSYNRVSSNADGRRKSVVMVVSVMSSKGE